MRVSAGENSSLTLASAARRIAVSERAGMEARIFYDFEEYERVGTQKGDVLVLDDGLIIRCPGCGRESSLPKRENGRGWDWNNDSRSLTPSVHHSMNFTGKGEVCGWHGLLTRGNWVSV
jgi:hypothetical protein